jgi:aspartate/methionine/tyrosine aminotransferase
MPGIGVDRLGAAADALARTGVDLLRLENLDTDLRPPEVALAATRAAIDDDASNSYLPFRGGRALREAAARHVSRLSGVSYDPVRQCVITSGGLNGCLATLLALLDPGDEVLVTDPTYAGMANRVRLAGGVPVFLPFFWTGGRWALEIDDLRRAISPRTRAMFLMSPSMPSGAVLDRAEWNAVVEICVEEDLWLVYDAAMERILFDGTERLHPAGLPDMMERTVVVGSASKELRMIGWRVGWVVGPAEIVADVGQVHIGDGLVAPGISQPGVAAALDAEDADAELLRAVEEWQRRRDVLLDELAGLPVRCPCGGWSLLLDCGELGMTGEEASERLLERARIAATPMTGWGIVNGPQFLRFVYSNEPVERLRGIGKRIRAALD